MAAFLAIYQAVAKPSETVRTLEETVTAFSTVEADLERLCRKIKKARSFTDSLAEEFEEIVQRRIEFAKKYVDATVNNRLRARCTAEVLSETPTESFYIPLEAKNVAVGQI